MNNNWIGYRRPLSLVWPAALLGTGGAAGLWLWLARGDSVQVLVASAILAVTLILGIVWQSRARAMRRLQAALDAYVAREIARARRRKASTQAQKIPVRAAVWHKGSRPPKSIHLNS